MMAYMRMFIYSVMDAQHTCNHMYMRPKQFRFAARLVPSEGSIPKLGRPLAARADGVKIGCSKELDIQEALLDRIEDELKKARSDELSRS